MRASTGARKRIVLMRAIALPHGRWKRNRAALKAARRAVA